MEKSRWHEISLINTDFFETGLNQSYFEPVDAGGTID